MADEIKVSEVTDVLLRQLSGIETGVQFDETGVVLQSGDGVVRIYGLRNAGAGELLEFDNGVKAIVMNLEEIMWVQFCLALPDLYAKVIL
jgi:F-type H+-transporting ATPase subunit alpha